jgi:predicted nucleotide-binding protein
LFYYQSKHPPKIQQIDSLNRSETSLLKEILEPIKNDQEFDFNGKTFQASDVADYKISGTPQKISEITVIMEDFPFGGRDITNRYKEVEQSQRSEKYEHKIKNRKVFIVHGRNHAPMKELRELLVDLRLIPIVLQDQASGGSLTLVEKLEKYTKDASYAFVILTPEDLGGHNEEIKNKLEANSFFETPSNNLEKNNYILSRFENRARQNVIFEMGYLFALLGRKNVCCLLQGKMENPTDIDGVVYGHFNKSIHEVRSKIVKELKEAKMSIVEN